MRYQRSFVLQVMLSKIYVLLYFLEQRIDKKCFYFLIKKKKKKKIGQHRYVSIIFLSYCLCFVSVSINY